MSTITCTNFHQKRNLSSFEDGQYLLAAHGAFLELYNMDNFVKNFDKKECEPTRTKVFDTSDVHKYVIFEESGHVLAMTCGVNREVELVIRACLIPKQLMIKGGYFDRESIHELNKAPATTTRFEVSLIPGTSEVLLLTESVLKHFRYYFDENGSLDVEVIETIHLENAVLPTRFTGRRIVPLAIAPCCEYSGILCVLSEDGCPIEGSILYFKRDKNAHWWSKSMQNLDGAIFALILPGTDIAVAGGMHCKFFSTKGNQRGSSKGQLRVLKQGGRIGRVQSMTYCAREGYVRVFVFGEQHFSVFRVEKEDRITLEKTFSFLTHNFFREGEIDPAKYYQMPASMRQRVGFAVADNPICSTVLRTKSPPLDLLIVSYFNGDLIAFKMQDIFHIPIPTSSKKRVIKDADRTITIEEKNAKYLVMGGGLFLPDRVVRHINHIDKNMLMISFGNWIQTYKISKGGAIRSHVAVLDPRTILTSCDSFLLRSTGQMTMVYGTTSGHLGVVLNDTDSNGVIRLHSAAIHSVSFFAREREKPAPTLIACTISTGVLVAQFDSDWKNCTKVCKIPYHYDGPGSVHLKVRTRAFGDDAYQAIWVVYNNQAMAHFGTKGVFGEKYIKQQLPFSTEAIEAHCTLSTRKIEASGKFADLVFILTEDKKLGVLSTLQTFDETPVQIMYKEMGQMLSRKSSALHAELLGFRATAIEAVACARLYVAHSKSVCIIHVKLTYCNEFRAESTVLAKIATTTADPSNLSVISTADGDDRNGPRYGLISGYEGTEVIRICPKKLLQNGRFMSDNADDGDKEKDEDKDDEDKEKNENKDDEDNEKNGDKDDEDKENSRFVVKHDSNE